ncbi:MAG: hypothetical protein ACLUB2_01025 [Butyricicoccus pullicaecorum]
MGTLAAVVDGGIRKKGMRCAISSCRPADGTEVIRGQIDCTLGTYVGPHLLGAGFQVIPDWRAL